MQSVKRKKRLTRDERKQILIAKRKHKKERQQIDDWLSQNKDFDSSAFITKWSKSRTDHRDFLVNLITDIHSISDAVIEANKSVSFSLGMRDGGIDLAEVIPFLRKFVRIKIAQSLIESLELKNKEMIIERIIAREFPLRDNSGQKDNSNTELLNQLRQLQSEQPRRPKTRDPEKLMSVTSLRKNNPFGYTGE